MTADELLGGAAVRVNLQGVPDDGVSPGAVVEIFGDDAQGAGQVFDVPVFLQHNRLTRDEWGPLPPRGAFVCRLPRLPLPPDAYRVTYSLVLGGEYLDAMDDACELTVTDGDFFGSGEVPPATHGCCLVDASWRLEAEATPRVETESGAVEVTAGEDP